VANDVKYLPPATVQLVEATAAKAVYSVNLPDGSALPAVKSSWFDRMFGPPPAASQGQPTQFDNVMIVPIADARVIVGKSDKVLAATVLQVGITSVWNAILTTLVAVVIAHGLLYLWAVQRQVPGHSPWMRLVTTREGNASLSQAQIMIWSFLFGAGAVYVMILSGSLFNIPNTALVLLGISGATTVGAKIQMANARAAPPAAPPPPPPVAQSMAPAAVGRREPQWSDLVVTPQHPPEIDVTRVQMLFFTLISASFVAIKLITSFAIPDIPDGFMLLMGISNGVYLTAKFVPD
jgi:hypothetical protein